jgi:hypothetical protein
MAAIDDDLFQGGVIIVYRDLGQDLGLDGDDERKGKTRQR